MSFNRTKYNTLLKTRLFEFEKQQYQKYDLFLKSNRESGTIGFPGFYNLRTMIKVDHLKEYLDIVINCLIESVPIKKRINKKMY